MNNHTHTRIYVPMHTCNCYFRFLQLFKDLFFTDFLINYALYSYEFSLFLKG